MGAQRWGSKSYGNGRYKEADEVKVTVLYMFEQYRTFFRSISTSTKIPALTSGLLLNYTMWCRRCGTVPCKNVKRWITLWVGEKPRQLRS